MFLSPPMLKIEEIVYIQLLIFSHTINIRTKVYLSLSYLHDSPLYSLITNRRLLVLAPTPLAACRKTADMTSCDQGRKFLLVGGKQGKGNTHCQRVADRSHDLDISRSEFMNWEWSGWIELHFPKHTNRMRAKIVCLPELGIAGDGLRSVQGISVPKTCKTNITFH